MNGKDPKDICRAPAGALQISSLLFTEYSTANLDLDLGFIDVIPEEKIEDLEFVSSVLKKNREYSVNNREEIKEYAETFHGWKNVTEKTYLKAVYEIAGNFEPFIWSDNV